MPLEIKIGILNNKDNIIITEDTGNYNAITNLGGWGAPNPAYTNPPITAITLKIYLPGTSTPIATGNLITTTYFTSTDRAYNLYTDSSDVFNPPAAPAVTFPLQDGVWKYEITYTGSGISEKVHYSLRTNDIRCKIGELALGDMDNNNYDVAKTLYDKMVQAFECGEYILAQDLYEELNDFFTDCSPYSINSCGC
jgi:hypothetical protein